MVFSVQDTEGNTALHCAAYEGHTEVITTLVGAGCDPNTTNYQRRNPLHLAAMRGHLEAMRVLMTSGGDCDVHDASGNLPIWYSTLYKHTRVSVFLIQKNSSLGGHVQPLTGGKTSNPLLAALQKRHLFLARILVVAGCDRTPLSDWLTDVHPSAWTDDSADNHSWLKYQSENPDSLSSICRLSIRRQLGKNVEKLTLELPLPRKLKDMVLLKELEDMCVEEEQTLRIRQTTFNSLLPYIPGI